MIYFVTLLAVIFFLSYLSQKSKEKKRTKQLDYLVEKLQEIQENHTHDRLRFQTEDEQLRKLALQCNLLLEENQENERNYRKSEDSMRKMLSNVSHDLKTPLTVVLGYLEILQMNENMEQLSMIYHKVKQVLNQMNEFFDLAKLESKDKFYPVTRIDVAEICRQVILEYYEEFSKRKIMVELELPETAVFALCNEEALTRILNNLISNAIKYGMDGNYFGLFLRENADGVDIQVIDHGKGIEKKYQDKVFERLYTLEDSRSTKYQGSGLGLSITKALIEQIGGMIHLKSDPYQKTMFEICLKK